MIEKTGYYTPYTLSQHKFFHREKCFISASVPNATSEGISTTYHTKGPTMGTGGSGMLFTKLMTCPHIYRVSSLVRKI